MATADRCVSIHPYFKIAEGKLAAARALCEQFVAKTSEETACLYYGFSFCDDVIHCREAYDDAQGLLDHLASVGPLIDEMLKLSEIARLEIHGIESELAKLREPLASLNPTWFTLEYGIRR